jgi:outer membrane protein insertion porin family
VTRAGVVLLLLCLAAAPTARAQDAPPVDLAAPAAGEPAVATGFKGVVVSEIEISGNRRIEADAVKAVIGTKVGEKLSQSRLAEDLRRIYGLGFFHNVRVDVDRAPGGGAIVTYHVEENPVIRQVSISGNQNLGSDDIKGKLTITVGSTVDYPLLIENQQRIEAQYQAKGYYQAKVNYTLEPQGEGSVGVNFDVNEGKKLKLREIDFRGNQALSDRQLNAVMQTKVWTLTSWVSQMWDNSGLYAEPLFYQDLDKIQRLYMDQGYIRVQVGEPEVQVTDEGIKVAVDISEGPQYRVGTIDVLGDETMDRDQLLALIQQKTGDVFSRSKLTGDVDRLRSFYGDRGFYDAAVNPITQVDPEKLTVACNFEVKKGELYFVDGIDLHGNTRTADTVVRRELTIAEGDMYSTAAVAQSKMRVQRLGYFEEVDIAAKPSDEPHRVAMAVDVVEKPTGSFSFGAGFGSVDGFIISGSVRQDNLFGTGRSLSAGVDLGSINRSFYLRFIEPYVFGTSASMALTGQSATSQYVDFEEKLTGASVNFSYPLDESYTYASGGYAFSGRKITGFESVQAASLLEREEFQGLTTTSLVTMSVRRDTRRCLRPGGRVRGARRLLELPAHGGAHDAVLPAQALARLRLDVRVQLAHRLRHAVQQDLGLQPAGVRSGRLHVARARAPGRLPPGHRHRPEAAAHRALLPRRDRRLPGARLQAALTRPAAHDPVSVQAGQRDLVHPVRTRDADRTDHAPGSVQARERLQRHHRPGDLGLREPEGHRRDRRQLHDAHQHGDRLPDLGGARSVGHRLPRHGQRLRRERLHQSRGIPLRHRRRRSMVQPVRPDHGRARLPDR